jgi:hypothetical protein
MASGPGSLSIEYEFPLSQYDFRRVAIRTIASE